VSALRPSAQAAADVSPPNVGLNVEAPAGKRRPSISLLFLIAGILTFALYYVVTYVPALGNGSDFQDFYSAAVADKQGVDPFNWAALWNVQQQVYNGGIGHSAPFSFAPYPDPPPFALLIRPFTAIPESQAYHIWAALLLVCGAVGAYSALYQWPSRPRLFASALIAVSPAALFDLRLGQNSTPLLLALGAGYRLIDRGRPFWGGICLGCGFFKPHLMGPIAVIVILAAPKNCRAGCTLGTVVAGSFAFLAGLLFDGGFAAYGHWLADLKQYGDTIGRQPDLASVSGLYQGSAASGILNALCLLTAGGIIARLAWQARGSEPAARRNLLGGGIAVYLALSPYVHTSDQILLAPGLLGLVGPHGQGLKDRAVLLAAWIVVLAPMVVIRDYHTTGINALPPIAVAFAYWMQARPATKPIRVVHG
jgi:hypothetical protein